MMRNKIFLGILLFLVVLSFGWSLEISTEFHIGNLALDKSRASTDTTYTGMYFPWGINVDISHPINNQIGISASWIMDPVLRNTLYTQFTFKESFINVAVGPFFGVFNSSSSLLKAGINAIIQVEYPGIVFFRFRADSSIGGRLIETGDYIQERNDIVFGFYVPNAVCSLGLTTKKYTEKIATGESVDRLTEYFFATEIFQKNVPYKINVRFAYHRLSKTFLEASTTVHGLGSLVVGFRVDVDVTKYLTVFARLDSSIYTFGTDALLGVTNPGPGGYLFNTGVGCKLDLANLR